MNEEEMRMGEQRASAVDAYIARFDENWLRAGVPTASTTIAIVSEIKRLRAELIHARYAPIGDNHHNAMACPYCNPKGQRP